MKEITCSRRRLTAAALLCLCLVMVGVTDQASAQVADLHPRVAEAAKSVRDASGPNRYAELRKLWGLWDRSDPRAVEQALFELSSSAQLEPPARAYAGLLWSYARKRRGDLAAARGNIARLGFVDQWLVVGPFDNDGKTGLDRPFGPESDLNAPLDVQRMYEGKERPVRWRPVPTIFGYGWVDLGEMLRPSQKICGFATTFVSSTRTAPPSRPISVWLGASGSFTTYWNGEQVQSDPAYRALDADRFATTVTLKPGWNRLTVKVCADGAPPILAVRLADATGAPDATLRTSADPATAADAAKNAVAPSTKATDGTVVVRASADRATVQQPRVAPVRKRDPGRVRGPVQLFDAAVAAPTASANVLEAYANYLMLTGGDDPAERNARQYALRAADQSPTVNRLLLAGKLSEDRNQQRQWIEKAEAKAGGAKSIEVLLAKAQLLRVGLTWRDAIPYFDQLLKENPDDVTALMGRADLYNRAGLQRTALATLERALERNPHAVSLLRAYALQLASLGRDSEAEEVQERYAAFRFDDPTHHMAKLVVAVDRRDEAIAEHWIERLLEADPYNAFRLSVVARAYAALGKPDKALASYEKALELAPEDTTTMRELADLYAQLGHRDQQMRLLRQVLVLRPQFKDVREYVEHIEPTGKRIDESYAWEPERFLPLRTRPAQGFNRRTLRELEVTTVYPSGLSSSFHQVVFQPLTDEAAASAREYAFAYQADRQVVQLRSARVYRADGRVDEAIESNEGPADNPAIAMYTSARTFYVQFPRLNVGDVVELRYRIEEIGAENAFANYFGQIHYMQSTEPLLNAEYVVIAPSSRTLHFAASPLPGLERSEKSSGDSRIYRFFTPEVAPILPEPKMPPWSEVLGHVHVSTYRTWDDVGRWYWGLAKDQLIPDDEVRRKTLEITRGLERDDDKVRAIYGYVVQRTRYVALEFGIYGYKPRRAALTFARGWGDCKDKAALIVSMLKVVGIPASMVLVRTSMRGDFPMEPASLAPFDHAIAYVPSMDLYLDGTAEYTGSTEFPAFDRGSLGLIVNDGGAKLVRLPDPPASETQRSRKLEATMQNDGSANVDVHFTTTGAFASQWRMQYHGDGTRRDRVARDIARDLPGFQLTAGNAGLEAADMESIEKPVTIQVRGRAPAFGRREGSDLSIPVTPGDRFVGAFANLSQRRLDLMLGFKSSVNEQWTIRIPQGMRIKAVPEEATINSPFGSFDLKVQREESTVVVKTVIALEARRIKPADYVGFAAFCEAIDRSLSQRLLLEKAQ